MTTTPSPAEIAAKLSEAQRNAMMYIGGYHGTNVYRALRRKGLYDRGLLTELGSAVRDAIFKQAGRPTIILGPQTDYGWSDTAVRAIIEEGGDV